MRTAFAIAAIAGAALAAPYYGQPQPEYTEIDVVVETVINTIYVTDSGYDAQPTPISTPVYQAPTVTSVPHKHHSKHTSVVYQASSTAVYQAPSQPAYTAPAYTAPAYTAAPAASSAAPAPSSTGYMAVVDEWRAKLGKPALVHDDQLETNALNCVTASNGQMIHKLNPGSFGQVLAPGNADDFEHVFVGGWLCEMPNLPGLDGICATESSGWKYDGQTGHAQILAVDDYSKIGCALYAGIWGCDVA